MMILILTVIENVDELLIMTVDITVTVTVVTGCRSYSGMISNYCNMLHSYHCMSENYNITITIFSSMFILV